MSAGGRRPRSWLRIVVAALAVLGFAGVYVIGVLTARGQLVEQAVLDASSFAYGPALLSLVSVPALLAACAVVAAVGLVRRRPVAAIAGVAVIGVSTVLSQLLKNVLLVRPDLGSGAENTFPSGHMVVFSSVVVALLVVLPVAARPVVASLSAVLLCVVAGQLLYYGWHRPSDVAGAVLLVTAVLALVSVILPVSERARRPLAHRRLEVLLATVGVLAGVGALVASGIHLLGVSGWITVLAGYLVPIAVVLLGLAIDLRLLRTETPVRSA